MDVWPGIIETYRDLLPVTPATPVVTLLEGGTPLLPAPKLSDRVGARVMLKIEGLNPTGSFKDRGMTLAISKALEEGAKAVVCASTGNTSASAAAYAVRAGLTCAVLIPEGHIALGKLAQALVHGAKVLQVRGNFDEALAIVRRLGDQAPVTVVNSINPYRIQGQKTGAFEIVDTLGDAPDVHCIPVGNAGNITAYWRGYCEYRQAGRATQSSPYVRLPGGRCRSHRRGAPHRESGDDRHRHPYREPRVLVRSDGSGQRVRGCHRGRHRRGDPRVPIGSSPPRRACSARRRPPRRWPGFSRWGYLRPRQWSVSSPGTDSRIPIWPSARYRYPRRSIPPTTPSWKGSASDGRAAGSRDRGPGRSGMTGGPEALGQARGVRGRVPGCCCREAPVSGIMSSPPPLK